VNTQGLSALQNKKKDCHPHFMDYRAHGLAYFNRIRLACAAE
jgi:hypothetical protein